MLLDTSAYSALDKGSKEVVYALAQDTYVLFPTITMGELLYGFANGSLRETNEQNLEQFIAQEFVSVIGPTSETAKQYAEIASYARSRGRALSQNDLWIAALAKQHKATLVTYDKDFSHVSALFTKPPIILEHQ